MRVVMFCHSLVSDWNYGDAHFLRGVATELLARGHRVIALEPESGWSRRNLESEYGTSLIGRFERAYPTLRSETYRPGHDVSPLLDGADLVLVHHWTDRDVVAAVGEHRAAGGRYRLLFHDTRAEVGPEDPGLAGYDGVLAASETARREYRERWARRAWTWHPAADHRVFRPLPDQRLEGDLVWIGNWDDDERGARLEEFVLEPAEALGLTARAYGIHYPPAALARLERAGVEYGGWVPNFALPGVYARFRLTVHLPRGAGGAPTLGMFESLACGIPVVSSPWEDRDGLFTPERDYLVARDGGEMRRLLRALMTHATAARSLAEHGRRTILGRHTCVHRVNELLAIVAELNRSRRGRRAARAG